MPSPVSVFIQRREPTRDFVASPIFASEAETVQFTGLPVRPDDGTQRPVASRAATIPLTFWRNVQVWMEERFISGKLEHQNQPASVPYGAQLPWLERFNVRVPDVSSYGAYYEMDIRSAPLA